VPPVELKTEILVPFTRLRAGGDIVEVRARVSLGLQGMRFLSYSQVSPPVRTNRP
jgi:hypothetical protein